MLCNIDRVDQDDDHLANESVTLDVGIRVSANQMGGSIGDGHRYLDWLAGSGRKSNLLDASHIDSLKLNWRADLQACDLIELAPDFKCIREQVRAVTDQEERQHEQHRG